MNAVKKHPPGTFCWVELGTTDAKAATKFYKGLFGWSTFDTPAGPDMVYTMLQLDGQEVAALYQLSNEQLVKGIPPHWLSYISVVSADKTVQKAQSLGGKVLMEPFDVFDVGRMAVLQDPTGATFALWQARKHIGAKQRERPGTACWNELAMHNADQASTFYSKLFGWKSQIQQMGNTEYTVFKKGEKPVGGMLQMTEEWGDIPPNWMVYFAVEDCDRSTKKAKTLGAEIRVQPTDVPGVGRFAIIEDPQCAVFSILAMSDSQ